MATCFSSSSSLTERWVLYYCSQIEFTPPLLLKSLCKYTPLSGALGRGCQRWKLRREHLRKSGSWQVERCSAPGASPAQAMLSQLSWGEVPPGHHPTLASQRALILSFSWSTRPVQFEVLPFLPSLLILVHPGYLCLYLLWYLLCWKWKTHPMPDCTHPDSTVQPS